ncbi:hypothetical protein C8Q75DRAFT_713425 [Abortiporus biennis]|nr:hypothetical protein C8Q75DRAFT_713425 [Abortiporus biennis]
MFPSPVGGVPLPLDYAPSVLFSVLYALLVPVMVYRQARKRSRNVVTIGTMGFAVGQIVVFALRAIQAHSPTRRFSTPWIKYMQSTYGAGYISVVADLFALILCVVINASEGNPRIHLWGEKSIVSIDGVSIPSMTFSSESGEVEDRARERRWYRWICGISRILFLVPLLLAIVSGTLYPKAQTDAATAQIVMNTRYASSIVTCCMLSTLTFLSIYWTLTVRNIVRRPCYMIAFLSILLNVITIYRLIIMHNQTTSLSSTSPGSLNSEVSKACFYIFQAAPEWLTAAFLISINIPKRFGTGFLGDKFNDKKSEGRWADWGNWRRKSQ